MTGLFWQKKKKEYFIESGFIFKSNRSDFRSNLDILIL